MTGEIAVQPAPTAVHELVLARTVVPQLPSGDLWVFGYGSLMWRPGFEYTEVHPARLYGYHRSLCVWSWVHRGTRERPGLVFGLDAGGSCRGRLFRVPAAAKDRVAEYLYDREMVTAVYLPKVHAVHGTPGRVAALTFVVDRAHAQYAGRLAPEAAAGIVGRASGRSGVNRDYLINTVAHLEELGIREPTLQQIRDLLLVAGELRSATGQAV